MTHDIHEGDLLWQPNEQEIEDANLTHYIRWLSEKRGLVFQNYRQLWQWTVDSLADFWESIWDYSEIKFSQPYEHVLARRDMPGAQWFTGARLNYAENALGKRNDNQPMLIYTTENEPSREMSWGEAYDLVNRLATRLRKLGVKPGDRVVGYLPNMPETVIALLAVASVGAIWSCCPPDFGTRSVIDRFAQITPKVMIAAAGYTFGSKYFDRLPVIAEIKAGLPSLEQVIVVGDDPELKTQDQLDWDDALDVEVPTEINFEQVAFDHPLWVLYSSGTTGLPKPIVHGHGGILLEHAKVTRLHSDLKPSDRYFWYSSTGWMLWNLSVGTLLSGCCLVIYNGHPSHPDTGVLWGIAEQTGVTYFGMGAAYVSACIKADLRPNRRFDVSRIRTIGVSGSPLTLTGSQWLYANVHSRIALECASGGTDVCTGFVGGIRTQPLYAGEIQGPYLGVNVQAFDDRGKPVLSELGELVVTEPMPSMPLYFWDDANNERYRASYFDVFPGVWRHGDWIKFNERGGCVIYGRSDSTINRQGVRMGTSEIYQVVESVPEILDSLIVDLEFLGRPSFLPLFVVLREDAQLDDALKDRIKQKIKKEVSPRHVPDEIYRIPEVPYTLTGKKMEVPIRKILLGFDVEQAATPGAMRNPSALNFFSTFKPF